MKISGLKLAVIAAAAFAATYGAQASQAVTILGSANFNSPTYSDGALAPVTTATDTTTPGQDGWLSTSAGLTNPIAVSNSATNGSVSLATSGQDVRRLFDGGASITGGSVFFEADINVATAQAGGDYFIHLGDGGTSNFYDRTYIKSSGAGFVMALDTSSGTPTTYGSTVLSFGTTYHILGRYDIVAGLANDTGALFVNPTSVDGTSDTPYVAAVNMGTDATTIGGMYLRQGSGTAAATLTVDNMDVFTVTTPEPASLSLLAFGGAALLTRRRK
jgi:hypothetical protein